MSKNRSKIKERLIFRKDANKLIEQGWGIIDTSGRTRNLEEGSAIAMASNDVEISILFKAKIKKNVFNKFSNSYSSERLKLLMHSTGIYYILKHYFDDVSGVFICSDGFAPSNLKHVLKNFLGFDFKDDKVKIFSSLKKILGKKNKGDRLAYDVKKGLKKPTMKITEKELKKFLKRV